ncbi:MAG: N-acylneuraminate cytidylyltransferase [Syntrophorhabdus sp. PtaB.Bin027]|nr:MAG: N-acylneuraminate cytidylyltransferase [Syntrophorhabdus sp. PtaB.Bin027]
MKPRIYGIIPARGGSKGVPKKNIQFIAGKPLIYYTIIAGLGSRYINKLIVSTDDDKIFQVAESFGAIAWKRPENISGDDSPTIDTVLHVLEQCNIKENEPEIVVLLQPTSPLRTSSDIDSALELFMKNDCDSVISVVQTDHPPFWNMILEGKYLKSLMGQKYFTMRRQELPVTYIPNGAIFIASTQTLKIQHTFYGQKTIPYIMSTERSIDIDSKFDLYIVEEIMRKGEE